MIVNLKIQLIRKLSFCKIEFLYYINLSSSTVIHSFVIIISLHVYD